MGLKIFITAICLLSIFFYFAPIKDTKEKLKNNDIAIFIFEKPHMYNLDTNGLNRVVVANQVIRYKNKDEIYLGNITLNNSDKKKDFKKESIKANFIVKKGDIYTLKDSVEYKRDDFIKINTEHLIYDSLNKIVKNSKPFNIDYYTHKYQGENLYFDIENSSINSKNTHFEIDMSKKEINQ